MKSTKVYIYLYSLFILIWVLPAEPQTTESVTLASDAPPPSFSLNPPDEREMTDEDKYVICFDNDPTWHHSWKIVAQWIQEKNNASLTKLCAEAHFRRGFGIAIIYSLHMNASTLIFKNEKYLPMKIDVVSYVIKDYGYYGDTDTAKNRFYITEGARSDCVFYLTPINENKTDEYTIDRHVCGLIIGFK